MATLESRSVAQESMSSVSLTELAYLRRVQKYQKRKSNHIQHRLQQVETLFETRKRFCRSAHHLHKGLVDFIQTGNKGDFALLYQTFQTIRQADEEYATQSFVPTSSDTGDHHRLGTGFLDQVSHSSRDVLLLFLQRIASEPTFLLDRLTSLSKSELISLVRPISQRSSEHSAFGSPPRRLSDRTDQGVLQDFLDFSRHDALYLLVELVNRGQSIFQRVSSIDVWSAICAKSLSQQQPGSDKLVIAILNAHLEPLGKPALHIFESWLLETLRRGDFLLEKPESHSFRMRTQLSEGTGKEDQRAIDDFFTETLRRLLNLLKDARLTGVIPAATLELGRTIVSQMDHTSRQRQAAPYFLCTHWLFASYLADLIKTPESHGLLLSYHISLNARQRILHEIALRARNLLFDIAYSWKTTSPMASDLLSSVEPVVDLFRPQEHEPEDSTLTTGDTEISPGVVDKPSSSFLTVCPSDLVNLVHLLYPEQRLDLFPSSYSIGGSTLRSSASSVSGISLFRTTSPFEDRASSPSGKSLNQGYSSLASSPMGLFDTVPVNLDGTDPMFVARLKEACCELIPPVFQTPGTNHCDPFTERWTTLMLSPNGQLQVSNNKVPEYVIVVGQNESLPDALGISHTPQSHDASYHLIRTGLLAFLDNSDLLKAQDTAVGSIPSSPLSLARLFERAHSFCYQQGDFSNAHLYLRVASDLKRSNPPLTSQRISLILRDLTQNLHRSRDHAHSTIAYCEEKLEQLQDGLIGYDDKIDGISKTIDRLREKMWYITEIQSASRYEDIRRVASALRVMGSCLRTSLERSQPPLRHRSASRYLSQDMQLKAEAATLELLSAPVGQGGPNKLSDVQSDITFDWMRTYGVENICKAEERIHRFFLEINTCLDAFSGNSISENPVLWSSELFRSQRHLAVPHHGSSRTSNTEDPAIKQLQGMYAANAQNSHPANASLRSGRVPTPFQTIPETAFPFSDFNHRQSSHDYLESRSPTTTIRSSVSFWSTLSAGAQSPSSATSLPSRALSPMTIDRPLSRASCLRQTQSSFLEEVRKNLTSLLLSDFDHVSRCGSETDRVLRDPLNGRLECKSFKTTTPGSNVGPDMGKEQVTHDGNDTQKPPTFDFRGAFKSLLEDLEISQSPYTKLEILLKLQSILEMQAAEHKSQDDTSTYPHTTDHDTTTQDRLRLKVDISMAPRLATSQDNTIFGFRTLFRDPDLRPLNLFYSLQSIASLIPLHILDNTPSGRAFWNATIAALDLKQEICSSLIETADQIISYHTFNRGHSRVTSAAQAKRDSATFVQVGQKNTAADPGVTALTMGDAATLLQAAAKEGIPAAQRELATLYLTHPEVLNICLAPFCRPRDVFKENRSGGSSPVVGKKGDKEKERLERERYDPIAMATAQHWMERSAEGGDGLAVKYLRARDEFEKIP